MQPKILNKTNMITTKDFCDIIGNKMINDILKSTVRNNFQPLVAERMCATIDGHERTEHFLRFLKEYNEWYVNQLRNQVALLQYFVCYRS